MQQKSPHPKNEGEAISQVRPLLAIIGWDGYKPPMNM